MYLHFILFLCLFWWFITWRFEHCFQKENGIEKLVKIYDKNKGRSKHVLNNSTNKYYNIFLAAPIIFSFNFYISTIMRKTLLYKNVGTFLKIIYFILK